MSDHGELALRTAALHTEVQQLRAKLGWVDDADLRTIEECNPGAAWLLSLCFGGGGQLYNRDISRGLLMTAASVAVVIGAIVIHGGLMLGWLGINLGASIHAFMQARSVNRYLAARAEQQRMLASQQGAPVGFGLAAAMPVPYGQPPTQQGYAQQAYAQPASNVPATIDPIADLRTKLEKLAVLRASGVINDEEHRERRLELISEWTSLNAGEVDELLYQLLPLIRAGTVSQEDVDLIKRLGGRR